MWNAEKGEVKNKQNKENMKNRRGQKKDIHINNKKKRGHAFERVGGWALEGEK